MSGDVAAEKGFLCDKTAVLGDTIKGTSALVTAFTRI